MVPGNASGLIDLIETDRDFLDFSSSAQHVQGEDPADALPIKVKRLGKVRAHPRKHSGYFLLSVGAQGPKSHSRIPDGPAPPGEPRQKLFGGANNCAAVPLNHVDRSLTHRTNEVGNPIRWEFQS